MTVDELDDLIVAALRHEAAPWPGAADIGPEQFLDTIADHGVTALLASAPALESWPDGIRSAILEATRFEIAVETIRRQELARLLADLASDGVRGLLLKGAHLAYSHYPQPWLRPRLDTDLLVAAGDRNKTHRLLRALGYHPGTDFSGELVTHQFQYQRTNQYGLTDVIDLHWKIANPHAFADAFTFDELDAESIGLDALGPAAHGVSASHALMIACVHRAAHHDNSDCLIWLYDIHLLARAMTAQNRASVMSLAERKRLRSVSVRGIADARARFGTEVSTDWLELLQGDALREPGAEFLRTGRTKADILLSDLQALRSWHQRAKLVQEHLFPPSDYMRRAYGFSSPLFLPVAYVDRAVTGIGKWFRRDR